MEKTKTREANVSEAARPQQAPVANGSLIPEPLQTYGVGYLFHYHPTYYRFFEEFTAIGGEVDMYETLALHFMNDPHAIKGFAEKLGKPLTLHSASYGLGNVERPAKKVTDKIQLQAKLSNAAYIGEHMAFTGTTDHYSGVFLQPLGTDEQTQVLINNIKEAKKESVCPLIIENPSQYYKEVGRRIGQQLSEVSKEADVGILLSLSNIYISDKNYVQDRDRFLADLPLERVRQLHLICNNHQEESMPGNKKMQDEQRWMLRTMEELQKRPEFKPASVIFELEAMTSVMAEPQRLKDFVEMAKDLFYKKNINQFN
ncbi:MAG TPA: DUF692 family protein [Flavisolibacter sp.]|jgi:hypothetical protein